MPIASSMQARLAGRVLPLFRSPSPTHDGEEREFDASLQRQFVRLAVIGACLMLVATVGWWPTDSWLLPDEATVAAFSRLRRNATAVELLALVSFVALWRRPAPMGFVGPAFYALLLGVFAEALGTLGEAGLGWYANALIGVAPAALAPVRPMARLLGTAAIAAALPVGFFGLHPENLSLAGAPGQLSFSVFTFLLTLVLGEAAYRSTRRAFLQKRATDLANSRLAALTEGSPPSWMSTPARSATTSPTYGAS
jgi:hypothetical protein